MTKTKILILGKNGMLGSTLFRLYNSDQKFRVFGTVHRSEDVTAKNIVQVEATNIDGIRIIIEKFKPKIVVNCIGIINKKIDNKNLKLAMGINGKFPHALADVCKKYNSRLIHFSSDCVFSGKKGNYTETDVPDCDDWYGKSKLAGEIYDSPALTIRTSLIGPEINSKFGLLEWFLSQKNETDGYTKAIFSGFPTVEIARIIAEYIIPNPNLVDLYHLSSEPISKYDLLQLIAKRYKKEIKIRPIERPRIDRSLNSARFQKMSGYRSPAWKKLVDRMYKDHSKIKNDSI